MNNYWCHVNYFVDSYCFFQREWLDHTEIWCADTWPVVTRVTDHGVQVGQPSRTIYFTFISVLLYFLPIIIMTVAYSLIIWRLWSSSLPGERVESEVRAQNKIKKRVC